MKTMNNQELFYFCEQYSIILHSGIAAIDGLSILAEDTNGEQDEAVLKKMQEDMEIHGSLAHALEQTHVLAQEPPGNVAVRRVRHRRRADGTAVLLRQEQRAVVGNDADRAQVRAVDDFQKPRPRLAAGGARVKAGYDQPGRDLLQLPEGGRRPFRRADRGRLLRREDQHAVREIRDDSAHGVADAG